MIEFEPKAKEKTIEGWADKAFEAFSSLFSSKEDFIKYVNSLKNPRDAELFLQTGNFYLVAKKYQHESYVKLIMIISIIEKIANKEKEFQEFYEWIESQDAKINEFLSESKTMDANVFKEIIIKLRDNYFQEFGSRRNVLAFFKKHFTKEDKIKLIRSIEADRKETVERILVAQYMGVRAATIEELKEKGFNVEKNFVPSCYDWMKCWFEYGQCYPNLGCLLKDDESLLDKTLKKVVDDLYQMRSDFVHDATITPLNDKDKIFNLSMSGKKPILILLTAEDLERMFEKALKHYFDLLT
ncbi:MAG: hypothetical protein ABC585_00210 [Candidatus Methanosuratincola petrocarbonis]